MSLLEQLLEPQRLTEVVDVGANPIDGDPPYKTMLEAGLCRLTGFEPQPDALLRLQSAQGPNERYLPQALGDGQTHTLNICHASGMTSLFEPDEDVLEIFHQFKSLGRVVKRIPVQTQRLDDVTEIQSVDFLKIDIQGAELSVFQSGRVKLADTAVIQTEVSFIPLYKGQPTLGDIDVELRAQGFIPHMFAAVKKWPISPLIVDGNPRKALNQLLEADMVYVKDFTRPAELSDDQLKHLALIAHHCYRSVDLTMRCLVLLSHRGSIAQKSHETYLRSLMKQGKQPQ